MFYFNIKQYLLRTAVLIKVKIKPTAKNYGTTINMSELQLTIIIFINKSQYFQYINYLTLLNVFKLQNKLRKAANPHISECVQCMHTF